jgi:ribosomal protein L7/L12
MDELQVIQRLAIIEAQLLLVSQHLGIPCPPFVSTVLQGGPMGAPPSPGFGPPAAPQPAYVNEVVALARAGNKIEAIKLFRESTGCSLMEAKEAVEKIV